MYNIFYNNSYLTIFLTRNNKKIYYYVCGTNTFKISRLRTSNLKSPILVISFN